MTFKVGDWVRVVEGTWKSESPMQLVQPHRSEKHAEQGWWEIGEAGDRMGVRTDELEPYIPRAGEEFEWQLGGNWVRATCEGPYGDKDFIKAYYPAGYYEGGYAVFPVGHRGAVLKERPMRPYRAPEVEAAAKLVGTEGNSKIGLDPAAPHQWYVMTYSGSPPPPLATEEQMLEAFTADVINAELLKRGDKQDFRFVVKVSKPWVHVVILSDDGEVEGMGASLCSLDDLPSWDPKVGTYFAAQRAVAMVEWENDND